MGDLEKDIIILSVGVFISLMLVILGWLWNHQTKKVDLIYIALENHKLAASKEYVTHENLKEIMNNIFTRWDRMENKLDEYLKSISKAIDRREFEIVKEKLHERIDDLEKRKMDKPS